MSTPKPRLLVLGAHPDDAEIHAGGIASLYADRGCDVKLVSVTNGGAGHHELSGQELIETRRREAAAAGDVIGVPYETWEFPDGALLPTLELRGRIIREIRNYRPDLVLTHRTNDYHPDHRAVGQAVQDASYMVTVPLVEPETPILANDPIVAYMPDTFTRPNRLRPDVVLDITDRVDIIVNMLACHESQVFSFLPFNQGILDEVPTDPTERMAWLRGWTENFIGPRTEHFAEAIEENFSNADEVKFVEVYEISEYAGKLTDERRDTLFGG